MAPGRLLAGLALLTGVALAGAVRAPFQFDDVSSIPANSTIRRLWPPSIALTPPPGISVTGRPVVNYSFALNYAINDALGISQRPASSGRYETVSYHVVNIALHILCGLLLFGAVRRTLKFGRIPDEWRAQADTIAAAVSALWLIHPLQTEAVIYVVQRTELLVTFFYLGTLYASIRAWDAASRRETTRWYAIALVSCTLGMCCKEVMISAPLAVVLYDRAFRATSWRELRSRKDRFWFHSALQLTLILLALVSMGARKETVNFHGRISWHEYLQSQGWAILHYFRLIAWPDALSFDYGSHPLGGVIGIVGLVVLTAAGAATLIAWKRATWLAFCGSLFFMLLAPSSSVVPIQTEIAAERRMYLALAPVLVLIVVGVLWLGRRAKDGVLATRATRWAFAATVALLLLRTAQRSLVYNDPETLWRDAVAKVPSNPRAHNNLAAAILEKDPERRAEGELHLRESIAVDSLFIPSWANLADLEMQRGRNAEARELLEHALRINPNVTDVHLRLGGLLVKIGLPADGIYFLERALQAEETEDGYAALATGYLDLARLEGAEHALRAVLRMNPTRLDAINMLGSLLATSGRPAEAIPYLEAATRDPVAPTHTVAFLSLAYAQAGRAADAIRAADRASIRTDHDAISYVLLGRTMGTLGRVTDAERLFGEAIRVAPNDPEAWTRLGMAQAMLGKRADAVRQLRHALRIQPGYPPAQNALAKIQGTTP